MAVVDVVALMASGGMWWLWWMWWLVLASGGCGG